MGAQFGPQQYGDLSKLRWDSELPPWLSQTFSYSFRGIKRSGVSGGLSKQVTVLTTRCGKVSSKPRALHGQGFYCCSQVRPAERARAPSTFSLTEPRRAGWCLLSESWERQRFWLGQACSCTPCQGDPSGQGVLHGRCPGPDTKGLPGVGPCLPVAPWRLKAVTACSAGTRMTETSVLTTSSASDQLVNRAEHSWHRFLSKWV